MLSTMTTSENFPLSNQSGCPRSPFKSVIQPSYVPTIKRQNGHVTGDNESAFNCHSFQDAIVKKGKMAPSVCYHPRNSEKKSIDLFGEFQQKDNTSNDQEDNYLATEVPKGELERELSDLLEQLEEDDTLYEPSKPLKIDPEVLKLDFSKLSINGNHSSLEPLCVSNFIELKRTSHHLSGGGLLTDASQDGFKDTVRSNFCKLSGGGIVTADNVFSFDNLYDLDICCGGVSNFLNQISPSSPLTFDLTSPNDKEKSVTVGISPEPESTNPFKNFLKGTLEDENSFSPTNPFSDFCHLSSLTEIPSINCVPPRYENVSVPQKSFSQCSTRPASPVLKVSEDSVVSNPFLINETSFDLPVMPPQLFVKDSKPPVLCNSSSFVFAVPVIPIFQHNITNSSTQTGDLTETLKPQEPVYQNVTSQLRKFMKRNDHSEYDLQCLKTTVKDLRNSGWYYENVSWQESVVLLTDTEPGTFLIRDSSDPNFLFSLSVQTLRGPTSVRLHYVNGQFRLDAEKKLIPHMPSFNSVIELIDYYVENTVKNKSNNRVKNVAKKSGKHKLQKSKDQVWIDSQGNVYSNILLVKPLHKKDHFSTLQHLSRLTINKCIRKRLNAKVKFNFRITPVYESSPFQDSSFQSNFDNFCPVLSIDTLPLPSKLLEFLKEYPYCH